MSNAVSGQVLGDRGISPPGMRPDYKNYRSPYGPKYKVGANFHGFNSVGARNLAVSLGGFGVALGIYGLFFVSDIPRVRTDIMQKIPIIGGFWVKEVPPEDNPF